MFVTLRHYEVEKLPSCCVQRKLKFNRFKLTERSSVVLNAINTRDLSIDARNLNSLTRISVKQYYPP